jgi:hypothetical protein
MTVTDTTERPSTAIQLQYGDGQGHPGTIMTSPAFRLLSCFHLHIYGEILCPRPPQRRRGIHLASSAFKNAAHAGLVYITAFAPDKSLGATDPRSPRRASNFKIGCHAACGPRSHVESQSCPRRLCHSRVPSRYAA